MTAENAKDQPCNKSMGGLLTNRTNIQMIFLVDMKPARHCVKNDNCGHQSKHLVVCCLFKCWTIAGLGAYNLLAVWYGRNVVHTWHQLLKRVIQNSVTCHGSPTKIHILLYLPRMTVSAAKNAYGLVAFGSTTSVKDFRMFQLIQLFLYSRCIYSSWRLSPNLPEEQPIHHYFLFIYNSQSRTPSVKWTKCFCSWLLQQIILQTLQQLTGKVSWQPYLFSQLISTSIKNPALHVWSSYVTVHMYTLLISIYLSVQLPQHLPIGTQVMQQYSGVMVLRAAWSKRGGVLLKHQEIARNSQHRWRLVIVLKVIVVVDDS